MKKIKGESMRKIGLLFVALLLSLSAAHAQTLTTLQSDTFTRANAATLGSSWNYANSVCQISGNQAAPTSTAAVADCLWVSSIFPNDQSSQVTVSTLVAPGTDMAGAVVRGVFSMNGNSGYYAGGRNSGTAVHLMRSNGTCCTDLVTGGTIAAGNVIKVIATGCNPVSLTVFQNGTQLLTFSDSSASQICAGAPGVYVFSPTSTANAGVTNWSGFAVTTPPTMVNGSFSTWPQITVGQPATGGIGSLSGSNTNPQAVGFYIPQRTEQFFGRLQVVVEGSNGTVIAPVWVMQCSQDINSANPSWFQVPASLVPTAAPQLGDIFPIYGSFYDVSGLGGAACKFGLGATTGTVTGTLPVWIMAG